MVEQDIQAVAVHPHNKPQGCLKDIALTAARIFVHFVALLLVFWVLVSPVHLFIRVFDQEDLKLPAATLLIVNMAYGMSGYFYIVIPGLLLIDAIVLAVLQLPPRPWRFLARIWFSGVLLAAFALLALSVFAMAVPLDALLPPESRMFMRDLPVDAAPDVKIDN
jgi:hypothetical protein